MKEIEEARMLATMLQFNIVGHYFIKEIVTVHDPLKGLSSKCIKHMHTFNIYVYDLYKQDRKLEVMGIV